MLGQRGESGTWPCVAIVVVNWNAWRDTVECLESVRRLDYPEYRVVIVDNGSTDESAEQLRAWGRGRGGRFCLIENTENVGFAGGINSGIQHALAQPSPPDFVFLLNNDALLDTEAISECVKVSLAENAAIVGAVIRSRDGMKVLFAGARFPQELFIGAVIRSRDGMRPVFVGARFLQELFIADHTAVITQVEARTRFWESARAEASAMLLRSDVVAARLHELGYVLDPMLFMYFEETDLCQWAARRGYRVLMAGKAIAYHGLGGSTGGKGSSMSAYYLTRNGVLLARKWLPLHHRVAFHLWHPAFRVGRAIQGILEGKAPLAAAIWRGLLDGYRGVSGRWARHPVGRDQ